MEGRVAGMSAPTPRRPRKPRTLVQKLGAVVLGFESLVVFLAGLTIYGLGALEPTGLPDWWGIVWGSVMAVLMIALAGLMQRPFAVPAGWVLQGLVAAGAILVPAILLVALVFGTMWGYATIAGARIDAQHAAAASDTSENTQN